MKYPAKYPDKNYKNVIEANIENEDVEVMIVQSGSVDITNFDTRKNPTDYFDYFRETTIKSAKNIFSLCENALATKATLKKIILMKQIPRYDRSDLDPLSIKQALSQIFNNTLTELWLSSPFKQKIFVGNHNIECSGGIRESRYRNIQTGAFDGVHLYGSSGRKAYTQSVLNIFKEAGIVEKDFDHKDCFQTKYQSKQRNYNKNKVWPFDRDVRRPKLYQEEFFVPLKNRFECLGEQGLGNY